MTTSILPGTRVRTSAGYVGSVERVEPQVGDGRGADGPSYLLVRAEDTMRRYRFPIALVQGIGEETDQAFAHTVVQLALAPADLDCYAVDDDLVPGVVHEVETLRIPLVAEELVAETRPMQLGTVRLHKGVETTEQRLGALVMHEEVIVERIPADEYDTTAPVGPDETIIPVVEERLVVETRVVIVEYVRVRKRRVTEQREVRAPVRREVVMVQEQRVEGDAMTDHPPVREMAHAAHQDDERDRTVPRPRGALDQITGDAHSEGLTERCRPRMA